MVGEADKNLTLRISGNVMDIDGGFELNYLTDTLESIEKLIEKTYLYSHGKNRMNDEDRENLKIILKNPTEGSFVADIAIQIRDLTLSLAPFIAENGSTIWVAVKTTYQYLKTVIDAKKRGVKPMIENSGDDTIIVLIPGDNNNVTINEYPEYVVDLAERLSPEFENLTKNIEDNKIDYIDVMDDSDQDGSIRFDEEDKERFKVSMVNTEETFELKGQIITANSNTYTGKIDIYDNDYEIEPGEYSFTVDKKLSNRTFFKEKYLIIEDYICQLRLRVDLSRGLQNEINNIHILSTKDWIVKTSPEVFFYALNYLKVVVQWVAKIKLTAKQEKYVQGLVSGLSQREAYKQAYKTDRMKNTTIDNSASRLLKDPKITARYRELLKEASNMVLWSREQAFSEYEWLKNKAKENIKLEGLKKASADAFIQSIDGMNQMAFKDLELADKKLLVEIKKAEAQAEIIRSEADKLQSTGKGFELLQSLVDVVNED